jgi:hypothetical protein
MVAIGIGGSGPAPMALALFRRSLRDIIVRTLALPIFCWGLRRVAGGGLTHPICVLPVLLRTKTTDDHKRIESR